MAKSAIAKNSFQNKTATLNVCVCVCVCVCEREREKKNMCVCDFTRMNLGEIEREKGRV